MNPGEDGGWEPSTCLLRRRRRKQHANRRAATLRRANGTPTPSPIFWRLLSPESLDSASTGSAVALEVGVILLVEALDGVWLEDSELDDALEEVLEDCIVELEDALVVDELSELDDAEDTGVSVGLLDIASEVCALVSDGSPVELTSGGVVGHADCGPNCLTR